MEIRKARHLWQRLLLRGGAYVVYGGKQLKEALLPPRPIERHPRRIALFVSLELFGGGMIISAMAKLLNSLYPGATLTVIGEQHRTGTLSAFFKEHTSINDLMICPRLGEASFKQWLDFYRAFKHRDFEMCILSPNHPCSNSVFLYLCGMRNIVGPHLPNVYPWQGMIENKFLTKRVTDEHMTVPYQLLTFPEAYGRLLTGRKDFRLAELLPLFKYVKEALPQLSSSRPKVCLHPGGPPKKRWPLENFVPIGKLLAQQYGAAVLIIGGREEVELAVELRNSILRDCPDAEVHNCCGSSWNQTANFVANSVLYVGNNAGTMQIPTALGVPAIGVFPESDRWFSGPNALGEAHVVLARDAVADVPVGEVSQAIAKTWHLSQLSLSEAN